MLTNTTKKISHALEAVKHYAAWISIGAGMFALVGAAYGFQVVLDVRDDLAEFKIISAIERGNSQVKIDRLTDRTQKAEIQCTLAENALKNSNESRGQVQQLVNSVVRMINIDENHPR